MSKIEDISSLPKPRFALNTKKIAIVGAIALTVAVSLVAAKKFGHLEAIEIAVDPTSV